MVEQAAVNRWVACSTHALGAMQIGGKDVTVSIGAHVDTALVCQTIATFWPDGVVQVLPDIQGLEEYFIFKTDADRQSWDNNGLTEDNKDTLIHVLHNHLAQQITFVVLEEASSQTSWIVAQVIKQLV